MDFKDINDNIISKKWKERYASLSEEKRDKIDKLETIPPKEYLFKTGTRDKRYPEVGTLFELLIPQGIMVNGIVINTHLDSILGKDLLLVVIFKPNTSFADKKQIDCVEEALMPPQIISTELWKKGYAQNIGRRDFIINPDYCFYDVVFSKFFDEYGKNSIQKDVIGIYGLTTVYGLSLLVQQELVIRGDI